MKYPKKFKEDLKEAVESGRYTGYAYDEEVGDEVEIELFDSDIVF